MKQKFFHGFNLAITQFGHTLMVAFGDKKERNVVSFTAAWILLLWL